MQILCRLLLLLLLQHPHLAHCLVVRGVMDAVKPVYQVICSAMTIVLAVRYLENYHNNNVSYVYVVCSLSCSRGYSPSSNCTDCVLTNICEASNPCGTADCSVGSQPNQYTCDSQSYTIRYKYLLYL